jgi:hypothetical protein
MGVALSYKNDGSPWFTVRNKKFCCKVFDVTSYIAWLSTVWIVFRKQKQVTRKQKIRITPLKLPSTGRTRCCDGIF